MRRLGERAGRGGGARPEDSLRSRVERLVLRAAAQGRAGRGRGRRGARARRAHLHPPAGAEGAPFRRLVEELRRDAARSYLRDAGLTLAQVAYLLGYAEQSAFTAAFRRWTGQSPGRFRATELSG